MKHAKEPDEPSAGWRPARPLLVVILVFVFVGASTLVVLFALPGPPPCTPALAASSTGRLPIGFTPATEVYFNASFAIAYADVCFPHARYSVRLYVEGEGGTSVGLGPSGSSTPVIVNGTGYRIVWNDATANDRVDVGDRFFVSGEGERLRGPSVPTSTMRYVFHLDGPNRAHGTTWWTIPYIRPPPEVAFDVPSLDRGNATVRILSTSRAEGPWDFWVNLRVGEDLGTATTMPGVPGYGGSRVYVNGTLYRVDWTDADADGKIAAGDAFLITGDGQGVPPGRSFTFYLLWTDLTSVASASWST